MNYRSFAPGRTATLALLLLPLLLGGCEKERSRLSVVWHPQAAKEEMPAAVPALLRTTVESGVLPADTRHQKERVRAFEELRQFYGKRGYQPAWSDLQGPLPQATELVAAADAQAAEALDPSQYDREGMRRLLAGAHWEGKLDDPAVQQRMVDLDLVLTYNFLVMAAHTAVGRLQPDELKTDWYTKPRNVDLDQVLTRALGPQGIRAALAAIAPPGEGYKRLRTALARYREIAARGGWPEVPPGPKLARGASGERVRLLRARLAAEGDLAVSAPGTPVAPAPPTQPASPASPASPAAGGAGAPGAPGAGPAAPEEARYGEDLADAVSRFQARHGLKETGVVDADTLEALNVPAEARARQIAVNMERWRWMPTDLGDRYILVNVPEFALTLVDSGQKAMEMRVIVGKTQSKTPVFSNRITRIDLNPVWNVPTSIIEKEVAPALARDPGYLAKKGLEVVKGWGENAERVDPGAVDWSKMGKGDYPYRLRQPSGPENALGRIKFVVPDEFDVYLHDTPTARLFDATERDFSHGCVRLERPLDLAAYLLKDDPDWDADAIQDAVDSEETQSIPLKRPLPLHILYWTAWVADDGTVQFRKDIYGHDGELDKALAAEPKVRLEPGELRGEKRAEGARVPAPVKGV